ncbi:MAG: TPM domain-containing protein, partial [Rhodoglobus sp.]
TQDIAAAEALPKDAALIPAITAASSALAAAKTSADDPAAALAQLQAANASLEQVFLGVRDQQARIAQARSRLGATVATARAQVTAALEYVSTRRGGIGESARTRVSEADRHLTLASSLAESDPIQALAEAERANELAASALSLARSDVEGYAARQNFDQRGGGAYSGSDGADLGGLLTGWILGSATSGRSSPGSSSRSSWGGGGSGRSSRTGSFGGSSRSSRRSGGGRSRGGRF